MMCAPKRDVWREWGPANFKEMPLFVAQKSASVGHKYEACPERKDTSRVGR